MNKENLLQHVEKSPQAVAIHDKQAWLAIFDQEYCVEDPVGSAPHQGGIGEDAIGRFYDTFIAPNGIRFEVANDVVNQMHVVRDLTVHTTMSPSLTAQVPMHLLYELVETEHGLRIKRLAAHWELMPMLGRVFSFGFACVPVMVALTIRMFRYQGISGILGFSKAVFTVGEKGKEVVNGFFEDLNQKHFDRLVNHTEHVENFYFGDGLMSLSELGEWNFDHFETGKMLSAGNKISVSFVVKSENEIRQGVAIFEIDKAASKIINMRFYC